VGHDTDDTLMVLIANYYGMIFFVDHSVGRTRSSLEDAGLADHTMVIFTSDHGEWLGDHGLLLKGPMLFDGLLRVGMFMCGPGISGGVVVDSPVLLVDVAETVYDYCGIDDTLESHGVSLLNSIRDRGPVRNYVLNEWDVRETPFFGTALNLRTARTSRYRLTAELIIGGGELYDLHDDPHEEINRYDDAGYAGVRRELEDMSAKPGRTLLADTRR